MIDTHCHLDVSEFDADRDAVHARARTAGVMGIVVPAIDAAGWPGLLALCAGQADLYPALGRHPVYLARHRDAHLNDLERALASTPVVAVGEIGLDYQLPDGDPAAQRRLCAAQLAIARAADLPVLLHARKAHDDLLGLLVRARVRGGIVHAFNGSLEQARRYIDLGFKLGFGGMLTFPRSTRLRRLAQALPLAALVLETDAPDLTVASHQYQRNSPEYLPEVLAALVEVRGQDPAEIAAALAAGVPVAASMGAGGRLDPTRIRVGDLMDSNGCALARAVRGRLRRCGHDRGVLAVCSDEPAHAPLPPEDTGQGRPRAVNGTIRNDSKTT